MDGVYEGEEAAEWKHEAFDFLIQGELVRMSLGQFLLAKGITAVCFFTLMFILFCSCYSLQCIILQWEKAKTNLSNQK